jgi:hypothetical protein
MKTKRTTVTRRDFIKGTVGATISAGLLGSGLLKGARIEGSLSSVIIVRDQNVMDSSMIVDKNILNNMLDQILIKLTGKKNAKDAWLSMISPSDVIGLVPTPLMNPTHEELIEVVTESLTAAGVPEGNIRNAQGRSVDLEPITALISMPGLKAHWLTGIGTVIKNYILYSGAPRKYHYQDSAKLGEIWNLPQVKGKTKLILVDALTALCDKGPQPDPRYKWPYKGLIAGTDPVALDTVGLKIIMAKREEMRGEPWPLSPPPICVEAADRVYHLGTSDLNKIDIQTLGWTEGSLV